MIIIYKNRAYNGISFIDTNNIVERQKIELANRKI